MKTIIKRISLLLCVVATLASCERKPIEDNCICDNTLTIPIDIDWTKSAVEPQNVSVLIYDHKTNKLVYEHTYEHNSKDIQSYVKLPIGEYKAVVFNELRNQIDYISCVGHENYETLKFESNNDTPLRSRATATTRGYVKQPGDLAVSVVNSIVVTKDMIVEASEAKRAAQNGETKALSEATKAAVESLMNVVTEKKTNTINISAHIKNIYYARMPSLVDLSNLADGYFVSGDKNSESSSTLQFTMNNRTYDEDSFYDGTISTTVTSFGTLGDRASTSGHDSTTPIILDLLFKLVDKDQTETALEMDVTSKAVHTLNSDGSYTIDIHVSFDKKLPEVEPEGSEGDSGFGSELEDWDDVEVPLEQ